LLIVFGKMKSVEIEVDAHNKIWKTFN